MGGGDYEEISILIDGWLWNPADLDEEEASSAPVESPLGSSPPDESSAPSPCWLAL